MSRHHRQHNRPAHVPAPTISGTLLTETGSSKILPGDVTLDLAEMSKKGTPSFQVHNVGDVLTGKKKLGPVIDEGTSDPHLNKLLNAERRPGEETFDVFERLDREGKLEKGTPLGDASDAFFNQKFIRGQTETAMPAFAPALNSTEFTHPATAEKIARIMEPLSVPARQRVINKLSKHFSAETFQAPEKRFNHEGLDAIRRHATEAEHDAMQETIKADKGTAEIMGRVADRIRSAHPREADTIDLVALKIKATEEIIAAAQTMRLQSVQESCFHKVLEQFDSGKIIVPVDGVLNEGDIFRLPKTPHIFLIQHDWAGAFENAQDVEDGEIHLPYSVTCFETRISGLRVCFLIEMPEEDGGEVKFTLLIETSVGWSLSGIFGMRAWSELNPSVVTETVNAPYMNLLRKQVRAICIALEAEVASADIVRAPHRLNAKREKAGKLPLFDYHVVSLASRKKYLPREIVDGELEQEHRHRRMHFVRGHWVHYTNHKTWRKWHLRGDPDLGFIDKHYKL